MSLRKIGQEDLENKRIRAEIGLHEAKLKCAECKKKNCSRCKVNAQKLKFKDILRLFEAKGQ